MLANVLAVSLLALSAMGHPNHKRGSHNAVAQRATNNSTIVKRATYSSSASFYDTSDSDPQCYCSPYIYNNRWDKIVALNLGTWMNSDRSHCFKWITVQWKGKTTTAQVVDACAAGICRTDPNWIDLSPGAIQELDPNFEITGVLTGVQWWFSGDDDDSATSQEPSPSPSPTRTSTYTPPETSTWTPPPSPSPEPSPSPSPEPSPSPSPSPSPEPSPSPSPSPTESSAAPSSTSSSLVPSSSVSSSLTALNLTAMTTSAANASISASPSSNATIVNATAYLNLTGANLTSTAVTVALPNSTSVVIAPDAIVQTAEGGSAPASGNVAAFNELVAALGRIIVKGASS